MRPDHHIAWRGTSSQDTKRRQDPRDGSRLGWNGEAASCPGDRRRYRRHGGYRSHVRRAGLDVSLFEPKTLAQREVGAGIRDQLQRLPAAGPLWARRCDGAGRRSPLFGRLSPLAGRSCPGARRTGRCDREPLRIALLPFPQSGPHRPSGGCIRSQGDQAWTTSGRCRARRNRRDRPLRGWRVRAWRSPHRGRRNPLQVRERLFGEEKAKVLGADRVSGLATSPNGSRISAFRSMSTNWVGPGGHFVRHTLYPQVDS